MAKMIVELGSFKERRNSIEADVREIMEENKDHLTDYNATPMSISIKSKGAIFRHSNFGVRDIRGKPGFSSKMCHV